MISGGIGHFNERTTRARDLPPQFWPTPFFVRCTVETRSSSVPLAAPHFNPAPGMGNNPDHRRCHQGKWIEIWWSQPNGAGWGLWAAGENGRVILEPSSQNSNGCQGKSTQPWTHQEIRLLSSSALFASVMCNGVFFFHFGIACLNFQKARAYF